MSCQDRSGEARSDNDNARSGHVGQIRSSQM